MLQAAHIKPYSQEGPHEVNNGLFLRSDVHTLFDDGYITIDKDYRIDVSSHLHEDYGNGKDYYKYHGQKLLIVPDSFRESRPGCICSGTTKMFSGDKTNGAAPSWNRAGILLYMKNAFE